jgi:hypothetical protein
VERDRRIGGPKCPRHLLAALANGETDNLCPLIRGECSGEERNFKHSGALFCLSKLNLKRREPGV